MGCISFFPWFTVSKEVSLPGFRLVPFYKHRSRHASSLLADFDDITAILSRYLHKGRKPISSATILVHEGKAVCADLSEDDLEQNFAWAECITLAGLATRTFFDHHYVNSDNFTLVVQRFRDAKEAPSIQYETKHGHAIEGYADDSFVELCPLHVSTISGFSLDDCLLNSLMIAMSSLKDGDWVRFRDALSAFNGANTDNPRIRKPSDVTMSVGAFERLVGGEGKQDILGPGFLSCFDGFPATADLPKNRKPHRYPRPPNTDLREEWIRDLFRARNDLAHGRSQPQPEKQNAWTVKEHLLISAFIFPLIVKVLLERQGLYSLSQEDRCRLAAFDRLIDIDHIFTPMNKDGIDTFEWREVLQAANWNFVTMDALKSLIEGQSDTQVEYGTDPDTVSVQSSTAPSDRKR